MPARRDRAGLLARRTAPVPKTAAQTFDDFWQTALHDGVVAGHRSAAEIRSRSQPIGRRASARPRPQSRRPGGSQSFELVFQPDPTIYDGRFANNGWLQELPKPITRLTWDNAALMSPATAKELGVGLGGYAHGGEHGGFYQPRGRAAARRPQGRRRPSGSCPATPTAPSPSTWATAARSGGKVGSGVGFNAYALRTSDAPLVRRRTDGGQDRRHVPARLHAGASPDGEPRGRPRRHARRVPPTPEFRLRQGAGRGANGDAPGAQAAHALPATITPTRAQVGHGDRPDGLHRLRRLRRRLPGGEQHPRRRQGAGRRRPRDALAAHRPLHRRHARRPQGVPLPAGALHALRERAVRVRLPRRGHRPQRRGAQRHGLPALRRHALLLQQLSLQGAAFQLLPLRRLRPPRACASSTTRT